MPSRLITPPDLISGPNSVLIINAIDDEIENLVAWLKTSNVEYDIHLYHCEMNDHDDWIIDYSQQAPVIIISVKYQQFVPDPVKVTLQQRHEHVKLYGPDTEFNQPVDVLMHLHNQEA